jgi:hypothetical protein
MTDMSLEDDFSSDPDGDNGSASLIPIEILHVFDDDDEISTYRTKNDPSRPHQRTNITQRKGVINIRCVAKDVVHGRLHPDGKLATLLVFDFRFDPCKKGRRILRADLSFTFASENSTLEVMGIAPDGRTSYAPTRLQVTTTRAIEIGAAVGGGMSAGGLGGLGASLTWEKTVSHESTDAAVIIGRIDDSNHDGNGPPTVARWTLLENSSAATGVPTSMRTAILLQRDNDTEFYAKFEMLVRPDNITVMRNLLARTPKDDPIIYKPTLQATNRLQKYNVDRLGDLDLDSLCAVAFANNG